MMIMMAAMTMKMMMTMMVMEEAVFRGADCRLARLGERPDKDIYVSATGQVM